MSTDQYSAFFNELEKIARAPIARAVEAFCKAHKLDPSKAIIVAGAAMHLHGLRPEVNDIDLLHPDLPAFIKEHHGGFEIDAGPGGDLPASARQSEIIGGLRVQTLPAILAFYQRLNRPKDQQRIAFLKGKLGVSRA